MGKSMWPILLGLTAALALAAVVTRTPEDPVFWTNYQFVVAQVSSVTPPPAGSADGKTSYELKVVESLHGAVPASTTLQAVLDPDQLLPGPLTPPRVEGKYWLMGLEKKGTGFALPSVILRVAGMDLPIELSELQDPRLQSLRKALPATP